MITREQVEGKLNMEASQIERICGFDRRSMMNKKFMKRPETQALLNLFINVPWLVELVEYKFNPAIADALAIREYAVAEVARVKKGN